MNPLAFCRNETFIPAGAPLKAEVFVRGDAIGATRRMAAVKDAVTQMALQPEGSVRRRLYALQAGIGELPEVDFPLQHTFAPGVYVRTIFIPKGSVLVGKIHRHAHANILIVGTVRVMTEMDGEFEMTGPLPPMVSEPGTKRAVLALTDTVWTTIHPNPTNTRDLAELEAEIITPTYETEVQS